MAYYLKLYTAKMALNKWNDSYTVLLGYYLVV